MTLKIRVPHIEIPPIELPHSLADLSSDLKAKLKDAANDLAKQYKESEGESGNYDNCVMIVAAGCAAAGASMDGPVGAALSTAGGVPAARLACRAIYPE